MPQGKQHLSALLIDVALINEGMDKLALMETFVAIVEEGSLSAAAKKLSRAPPTMVRSLALLEEHLGVRLLNRTTRRMSLTHEGRGYLQRCRQILGDISEAEGELADEVEPRGLLRLTAPVLFGRKRLAPHVREFLQAHPKMQVEMVLLDRVTNLVEEGFDLGVRIAHLKDSSLIQTRIAEVDRVLVASPALLQRLGRPRHVSDLSRFPAVLFSRGEGHLPQFVFQNGKKTQVVPVAGALRTNRAEVAIDAVEAGLGFGQFLSYQVEDRVSAGRLVRLFKTRQVPSIPVHLVFASQRHLSPGLRVFIDWLKERMPQASQPGA